MGKASRGKRARKAAPPPHDPARCLHCRGQRDTAGVWCASCTRRGREMARMMAARRVEQRPPYKGLDRAVMIGRLITAYS